MSVDRSIASNIRALNTIRNSFAHRYDLSGVPKSKRLHKGKRDVATRRGLKVFRSDMYDVHSFFEPKTLKIANELVASQKQRNRIK